MSFRELRDATEMLRSLAYPRIVSIENFRTPNFPLVVEILSWIVQKFDPNARLARHLDKETDRVLFIKGVVLILLQKAHVRLNPKHLYQSDGHAIRELLPVLRMLYESVREQREHGDQNKSVDGRGGEAGAINETAAGAGHGTAEITTATSQSNNALRLLVNSKRQELHQTVNLAAELPKTGATLYELLQEEITAKEVRTKALGRSLNAAQVEAELRDRIQTAEQRIDEVKERLQWIESDEQELGRKIERRRRELDQLQKRLAKLQAFRPPYMDEYERYEAQLRARYAVYVTLFRNLHALQNRLVQAEHAERERALETEQSMREMVERMRMESEQAAPIIAGIPSHIDELEDYERNWGLAAGGGERGKRRRPTAGGGVRVFGNMTGLGLSDDDEDDDEDDEQEDDDDDDIMLGGGRIIEVEDEEEEEEEEHHDRNRNKIGEDKFNRGSGDSISTKDASRKQKNAMRNENMEEATEEGDEDDNNNDDEEDTSGDNF